MTVNFSAAVAAYDRAVRQPAAAGPKPAGALGDGAADPAGGSDFTTALRDAAESAVEIISRGEVETLKAAAGQADLTDVVTAMSQAEITLQTVVTLRDRVIKAYQDIMRMPI